MLKRLVVLAVIALNLLHCYTPRPDDVFTCSNPDYDHVDENGKPDPCHERDPDAGSDADADADGSVSSRSCPGECVTGKPGGWFGPELWFIGDPKENPDCPEAAPAPHIHGFADPVKKDCGTCQCDPPTGTCGPPLTFAVSSAECNLPGEPTAFDPPAGWDGTCTTDSAIPANLDCNGVPCVRSVNLGPLVMIEEGCNVHTDPQPPSVTHPAPPPPESTGWNTMAKECTRNDPPWGQCGNGETCIPSADDFPGFRVCIYSPLDLDCPLETRYTVKYTVYDKPIDNRSCTSCACEAPAGSYCTGTVSIAKDSTCSMPIEIWPFHTSLDSSCHDVSMAGLPFGSKEVSGLEYVPGDCKPIGGEVVGSIDLGTPQSICCIP